MHEEVEEGRVGLRARRPLAVGAVVAGGIVVQQSHGTGAALQGRQQRYLVLSVSPGRSFAVRGLAGALDGADDDEEEREEEREVECCCWPLRAVFRGESKGDEERPNVRSVKREEGEEGRVVYDLVALRDIEAGEALVVGA